MNEKKNLYLFFLDSYNNNDKLVKLVAGTNIKYKFTGNKVNFFFKKKDYKYMFEIITLFNKFEIINLFVNDNEITKNVISNNFGNISNINFNFLTITEKNSNLIITLNDDCVTYYENSIIYYVSYYLPDLFYYKKEKNRKKNIIW